MGIRPHADEGAVTVNCWVTPDEANLVEGSGGLPPCGRLLAVLDESDAGLRVYRASVPDHMPFLQANRDFRAVRKHVEHAPRSVLVVWCPSWPSRSLFLGSSRGSSSRNKPPLE